jgi:trimethylamine--corrinoid protein Co-methyltransferase
MAQIQKHWLQFLSPQEIDSIHQTSLQILTEVGVRIEDREMTEKLQDCGCTFEGQRVKFTSPLIDAALEQVHNEVIFGSRSGKQLHVKEGSVFTHTGGSIPCIYDLDSGRKRDATLTDLRDLIRLMNTLDYLDMPGALVCPQDVPGPMSEIRQFEMLLRYSRKTISGIGVSSARQARYIIELYRVLADAAGDSGHFPLANAGVSPESPLYYPQEIVDIMKTFIAAEIPLVPLVAPIVGLTGPMTIAGGLAQMNASMLAFSVMAHLINPRTPIIYGARLMFANMRTGCSLMGLPEMGLAGACAVQLARHYGFPSDVYGLGASAAAFDNQLGYEKAVNGILPLLAGANIISGFGLMTSGLMSAHEQLVIDNETYAMLHRVAQGVTVTPDRLAVEVIANVMAGENFLEQEHTLKYLRSGEVFQPQLGFAGLWDEWEDQGRKDIRNRAREEVRRRLQNTQDPPLPADVDREFDRIIATAETDLLQKR